MNSLFVLSTILSLFAPQTLDLPWSMSESITVTYQGRPGAQLALQNRNGIALDVFDLPKADAPVQVTFKPQDLWDLHGHYRGGLQVRLIQSTPSPNWKARPSEPHWKLKLTPGVRGGQDWELSFPQFSRADRSIYEFTFQTKDRESLRLSAPINVQILSLKTEQRKLHLAPRHGPVTLYQDTFANPLQGVVWESLPTTVSLLGFRRYLPSESAPLSADLGTILARPPTLWRGSEYELYQWSAFPGVLILAFKDHGAQSRTLARLAFFVEKKGYKGLLLTNNALAGRTGYNAHNYRPEDLAIFFTLAAKQNFPLNPEELNLLHLLLENRLLIKEEGEENSIPTYQPGVGAVLSFSWQSNAPTRRLLLNHEAYHGFFFVSEPFRKAMGEIWAGMSPSLKRVWKDFLRWSRYDDDWEYLVINELHAFVLQQVSQEWPYFLRTRILPRSALVTPRTEAQFLEVARLIEEAAWRHGGLVSGRAAEWE